MPLNPQVPKPPPFFLLVLLPTEQMDIGEAGGCYALFWVLCTPDIAHSMGVHGIGGGVLQTPEPRAPTLLACLVPATLLVPQACPRRKPQP